MRRRLATSLGGAALLAVSAAAAAHGPAYVHPVGMYVEGRLHGDARSGCVWLADPGPPTQVDWPKGVTARFRPAVELVRGGTVLAQQGALIGGHVLSPTRPADGCPNEVKAAAVVGDIQLNPGLPGRH